MGCLLANRSKLREAYATRQLELGRDEVFWIRLSSYQTWQDRSIWEEHGNLIFNLILNLNFPIKCCLFTNGLSFCKWIKITRGICHTSTGVRKRWGLLTSIELFGYYRWFTLRSVAWLRRCFMVLYDENRFQLGLKFQFLYIIESK